MPFVQRTFETVFPGCNQYRIPGNPRTGFKYIAVDMGVTTVRPDYWRSQRLRKDLEWADCLVVNYMTPQFAAAVAKAPRDTLVVWVGWGADYYRFIEPFLGDFCLPRTSELVSRLRMTDKPIVTRLLRLARRGLESPLYVLPYVGNRLGLWSGKNNSMVHSVIEKIDYVSVLEEEKSYFELAFPKFRKNYHRIQLYSAEEVFSVGPERMCGPDILLGNSATPTNNHLELFDVLASIDLTGRKLIAPLNYGNAIYGDEIERIGRDRFGDAFVPLRNFLPLDEYYSYIASCGTVIMNHVRQQAGTTVAAALYKGAKVFLRNENPLLSFYRRMGIRICSIPDELERAGQPFEGPSAGERVINRQILEGHWGHDTALDAIRALEGLAARKRATGDARSTLQIPR